MKLSELAYMSAGDQVRYYLYYEDEGVGKWIRCQKYKMAQKFYKTLSENFKNVSIVFNGRILPEDHVIFSSDQIYQDANIL
jgi:hypothetical protein